MRRKKLPLRGSVTQNNLSVRLRAQERAGIGFLARLGILAGAILVIVLGSVWSWHNGWPQREMTTLKEAFLHLSQKAQFAVKDIVLEGRSQSNKEDVYDALSTERGAPLLALDTKAAAERLSKLPWVSSAIVERRLPDTVVVVLTERVPLARWQHEDHVTVIDREGHVLPSAKVEDFSNLPLIVGLGADKEADAFLSELTNYPEIYKNTNSIVRVGERRWDLHLASKIIVRLPEMDIDTALHRLSVLITQERILERDVVAIDLRLPDRLIIEPAQNAAPGASHL